MIELLLLTTSKKRVTPVMDKVIPEVIQDVKEVIQLPGNVLKPPDKPKK